MAARLLLCIVALTSISPSLAITPQWDDFASGNQITASGGTAAVNLDPALAYDSTYTVHYYVQVTLSSPGLDPYVGLTVAVDANNGSGWVERAAFLYERATSGTSTWSHEQKPIVVSGLDPNDDIRLRAKSFVKHDANGSFVIRGGDGGGSNPETYHGVTYDTVVGSPAPPIVSFRNHNGDNRDRSLCLTSSAGEAVAWQCGDLLVTHSLPGYRTMGRERTLTLLYNSAQAVPKPVVAVGVTQGGLAPSQVFVRLSINGFPKDSAIYGGWANGTRQIVMPYDAGNDSSGLYAFSLYVRNTFSGSTPDTTVSDTLLVVNRKSTLYGAGWSLAGIEELRFNQPGGKILWVGGDGSAKVFRPVIGDSLFVGALGGFRDSLFRFDSAGIRWWRRQLRYGVSVTYRDSVGSGRAKHVRTTNRVGNSTFFRWSGDTLTKILVPPDTAAFYSLSYAAGRLDKITDPAGRVLDVTIASDRLTQIIDPDTNIYSTSFAYDAAGRLIGRTNRRGFTNRYAYTNGLRVTADSIRLDTAAVTYGITTFTPWDERGLKTAFSGNTAIEVGNVFTKIDGALAVGDTAEFWVDRWGAPTSVRDPLGSQTFIARGDAANPALVTRVQTPDGRIVAATYDTPRGRLVTVVDSTFEGTGAPQVVTSARHIYGQSTAADSPTEIRTPVDTTRFAYDPTLGLTDSVIAPGGHRTTFRYFLSGTQRGLVQKVIDRGVRIVDTMTWTRNLDSLVTSFMYDHWGNDSTITTPQGNVTRYEYDSFRRPVRVYDPLSHLREYATIDSTSPRAPRRTLQAR